MPSLYQQQIISIHAPRVGSDKFDAVELLHPNISIHAPRVGSDPIFAAMRIYDPISIHAPRVGSDCSGRSASASEMHFNPRSPCGERLLPFPPSFRMPWYFNPRSPCGERP